MFGTPFSGASRLKISSNATPNVFGEAEKVTQNKLDDQYCGIYPYKLATLMFGIVDNALDPGDNN